MKHVKIDFYFVKGLSMVDFMYVRAFTLRMLKNIAYNISKNYFIYINISLLNTPDIKGSILTHNTLK